ncbi:MAG TPA: helix-turn-helix transcriptional regulator [Clostridia bacterium]|nr:helix-turn-helix transcriptional regulator [Clostridia bacterium]
MSANFDDFVREVEDQSTPEERRELDAARARFKLGARLLQQRLAADMTQKQLASASGVAQADISRIERGQANPTADTLATLARPLGVGLDLVPVGEVSELAGVRLSHKGRALCEAHNRASASSRPASSEDS